MKALPPGWQARIDAGVTHFAVCWRLTRRDGLVVRATQHDADLSLAGEVFVSARALSQSPAEHSLSLSPGHAALSGALSVEGINETDIRLGLWDQARVEAIVVDWQVPDEQLCLWTGYVQAMTRHGATFEVQIVTLDPALNTLVGRLYARSCDANLGDQRCGINLDDSSWHRTGQIASVLSDRSLRVVLPNPEPIDRWDHGEVRINGGPARGLRLGIEQVSLVPDGLDMLLRGAMPVIPAAGDPIVLVCGCDKSFATCRSRFANGLNFRGVPTLPGDGALLAGPSAGSTSGGRR
jgi:uncharacterized phage protein (TIGR02218 family)